MGGKKKKKTAVTEEKNCQRLCVRHQTTNPTSLPPQMISPLPLSLFFFAVDCFFVFRRVSTAVASGLMAERAFAI